MSVRNCCLRLLWVLLASRFVFSHQTDDDESVSRYQYPTDKIDIPDQSKVSKKEHSGDLEGPSPRTIIIPAGYLDEDYQITPDLMREIEAQLQDRDERVFKGTKANHNQDQQQKMQSSSNVDRAIKQVYSSNNNEETENRDLNDLRLQATLPLPLSQKENFGNSQLSSPYKIIIIKGSPRGSRRNTLRRRLLLKRLRSPLARSSNSHSDSENEKNSEELLHDIIEYIDGEDSDSGNPIKNAFLTKTTTYNITKLFNDDKNNSFLLEKKINYSTNLNLLHSQDTPTNYSDTHSSVLRTVLNLDRYEKDTEHLPKNYANNNNPGVYSDIDKPIPNNFKGGNISDANNEDSGILRSPLQQYNHQAPTEFLDGQYLPFVDTNPKDFVGSQYIESSVKSERQSGSLNPDYKKNNTKDVLSGQLIKEKEKKVSDMFKSGEDQGLPGYVVGNHIKGTLNNDETQVTFMDETITSHTSTEIPSLSLTQEFSNVNESKEQLNGRDLLVSDKINMPVGINEDNNESVTLPENETGDDKFINSNNQEEITSEEETEVRIHKPGLKQFPHSNEKHSSQDDSLLSSDSVLGSSSSETQTENIYIVPTLADGTQDKSNTMLDIQNSEFVIQKKPQIVPTLMDVSKIPKNVVAAKPNIESKQIDLTDGYLKSQINELDHEKVTRIYKDFETTTDLVTLSNTLLTEPSHNMVKSDSSKENIPILLNSIKASSSTENENLNVYKPPETTTIKNLDDTSVEGESDSAETSSTSTYKGSNSHSSRNEEYGNNSEYLLGVTPDNGRDSILETNLETGEFITDRVRKDLTTFTTQTDSFEELDVNTRRPVLKNNALSNHSDHKYDYVIGDASDIQPNKLDYSLQTSNHKGGSVLESQYDSGEQLSQVQNITGLIEDVELYAGNVTSNNSDEFGNMTAENSDSERNSISVDSFPHKSIDISEENATELCLSLTKKELPLLFDLLSGTIYLEKDGKKVSLPLKENPMRNCNSGTKTCKLYLDLKKRTNLPIKEEVLESSLENAINKDLYKISNNDKRHITEKEVQLKTDQRTERSIEENSSESTERAHAFELEKEFPYKSEMVSPTTENTPEKKSTNVEYNTVDSVAELPSSVNTQPVESMFISIPLPYKKTVENTPGNVQLLNSDIDTPPHNSHREKITLHSLDSAQVYDDKINWKRYPLHRFGFLNKNRFARKIYQKREDGVRTGGACGCNNPLLLSPSPIPDYRHFVGKRLAILTNMVHTVKDWVLKNPS